MKTIPNVRTISQVGVIILAVLILSISFALIAHAKVNAEYKGGLLEYAYSTTSNTQDNENGNPGWMVSDRWKVNLVDDHKSQILNANYSFTSNSTADTINDTAGHIDAINHILTFPCKVGDTAILATCSLFDSIAPHSTMIGMEYVIPKTDYNLLPEKEKSYWHNHSQEIKQEAENSIASEIELQLDQGIIENLNGTYGKIFLTWDPSEEFPSAFPNTPLADHPFMYSNITKEHVRS